LYVYSKLLITFYKQIANKLDKPHSTLSGVLCNHYIIEGTVSSLINVMVVSQTKVKV